VSAKTKSVITMLHTKLKKQVRKKRNTWETYVKHWRGL